MRARRKSGKTSGKTDGNAENEVEVGKGSKFVSVRQAGQQRLNSVPDGACIFCGSPDAVGFDGSKVKLTALKFAWEGAEILTSLDVLVDGPTATVADGELVLAPSGNKVVFPANTIIELDGLALLYHSSCSNPMYVGQTLNFGFGTLKVSGFATTAGTTELACPSTPAAKINAATAAPLPPPPPAAPTSLPPPAGDAAAAAPTTQVQEVVAGETGKQGTALSSGLAGKGGKAGLLVTYGPSGKGGKSSVSTGGKSGKVGKVVSFGKSMKGGKSAPPPGSKGTDDLPGDEQSPTGTQSGKRGSVVSSSKSGKQGSRSSSEFEIPVGACVFCGSSDAIGFDGTKPKLATLTFVWEGTAVLAALAVSVDGGTASEIVENELNLAAASGGKFATNTIITIDGVTRTYHSSCSNPMYVGQALDFGFGTMEVAGFATTAGVTESACPSTTIASPRQAPTLAPQAPPFSECPQAAIKPICSVPYKGVSACYSEEPFLPVCEASGFAEASPADYCNCYESCIFADALGIAKCCWDFDSTASSQRCMVEREEDAGND
eukprot:gene15744-19878_t